MTTREDKAALEEPVIDTTAETVSTQQLPPNPKEKFGATKPDLSLIPPVAMLHIAMAMENGAEKYGPFNWRGNAVQARTYVAAAIRHLTAWLDGEELSDDAEVHNLGHAGACISILLDAIEQGNLIDNRPPRGQAAEVQRRLRDQKVARRLRLEGK